MVQFSHKHKNVHLSVLYSSHCTLWYPPFVLQSHSKVVIFELRNYLNVYNIMNLKYPYIFEPVTTNVLTIPIHMYIGTQIKQWKQHYQSFLT